MLLLDLWGCFGAVFAPVLAWVCLTLLASDEASGLGDYYWESDFEYLCSFHSLVVGKVAVLLVAVVKVVTGLEEVDGEVTSTSNAVVIVAITLVVGNLVTGLVEVEIEMLDGHICLL